MVLFKQGIYVAQVIQIALVFSRFLNTAFSAITYYCICCLDSGFTYALRSAVIVIFVLLSSWYKAMFLTLI